VKATRDQPHGVPEAQYESFRNQLIEELRGFTELFSGESVVSQVWKREEVFTGPYMELAPDLTLELQDGGLVSILASETLVRPRPQPSGTHRSEGVFIARGPRVRQGVRLPSLSILDVAPLLLYSLDIPIPADFEGRAPTAAVEPAALRSCPIHTASPLEMTDTEPSQVQAEAALDAESEAKIMQRLRALGYVE
jgi:predicted AlkP superfamily phosphohydrolase/phosphomutase